MPTKGTFQSESNKPRLTENPDTENGRTDQRKTGRLMGRDMEAGKRPKNVLRKYGKAAIIVSLTLALGIWDAREPLGIAETFLPPAAIWVITGNPYGFIAGYFAFNMLENFWDPTFAEFIILAGITGLIALWGLTLRAAGISWRFILVRWLESLPEDNRPDQTPASDFLVWAVGKPIKIATCMPVVIVMFGAFLLWGQHQISPECRSAAEAVHKSSGMEAPLFQWNPNNGVQFPTDQAEFTERFDGWLAENPSAKELMESYETACRDRR